MEQKNHILGPLLIILTILVLAAAGYIWRGGKLPGIPIAVEKPAEIKITSQARKGEVISNFSKDLILAQDAEVTDSFTSTLTLAEVDTMTTIYSTSASVSNLYAGYVAYLNDHGYKVILSNNWDLTASIIGEKGNQTINISIYPRGTNQREVRVETREDMIELP